MPLTTSKDSPASSTAAAPSSAPGSWRSSPTKRAIACATAGGARVWQDYYKVHEYPAHKECEKQMDDAARIALVGDHPGELIGDTQPALRLGQQHDAAVGTDPPAVKGGGNLLAVDDWKAERQKVIVGHGGRGVPRSGKGLASATESYAQSKAYATSATPNPPLS